ncbi:MAG: hypothetical protein R6W84_04155 [Promethearchaeia archaeon]
MGKDITMSLEEMKEEFEYINWNELYFYAKDHDEAGKIERRQKRLPDPAVIHGILVQNDRYRNLPSHQKRVIELYSRMEALVDFELQTIEWIEK